jgi:hypothetical protein
MARVATALVLQAQLDGLPEHGNVESGPLDLLIGQAGHCPVRLDRNKRVEQMTWHPVCR